MQQFHEFLQVASGTNDNLKSPGNFVNKNGEGGCFEINI